MYVSSAAAAAEADGSRTTDSQTQQDLNIPPAYSVSSTPGDDVPPTVSDAITTVQPAK